MRRLEEAPEIPAGDRSPPGAVQLWQECAHARISSWAEALGSQGLFLVWAVCGAGCTRHFVGGAEGWHACSAGSPLQCSSGKRVHTCIHMWEGNAGVKDSSLIDADFLARGT